MYARDIMTSPVITISPDATVAEAARLLADKHIGGLPVVETDQLVGMFTESNLLHRVETHTGRHRSTWREWLTSNRELASSYLREHGTRVRDAMTSAVHSIDESAHVSDIADLLERRAIRRVPVLRDGKLVGIVSRSDLVRALATVASTDHTPVTAPADAEVREAIVGAFSTERWGLGAQNVLVSNGVVHLWGIVGSDEERRAIESAVENIAGVKQIESHLDFPTMFPIP